MYRQVRDESGIIIKPASGEYSGCFRHFKGNKYEVIGIARYSETEEQMVVYRALYGDHGLWIRPAKMRNETVERDGKVYKGFEFIGES